ncbi:hypothetical protein HGRIS_008365 [Hohenbuehelia grisea]|uniref:Uncharacterized protein n=1 Tax=Hohenbuehelia grisea TaxID=104357 RepID=A0ABR3J7Z9_9AGAR
MSGPPPQPTSADDQHPDEEYDEDDPYTQYSRELYQYTLGLWAESRRIADEKARVKAAAKKEEEERKRRLLEAADKAAKGEPTPSTSTSKGT